MKSFPILLLPLVLAISTHAAPAPGSRLQWRIREEGGTNPLPCRVHLFDEAGKPVQAPGLPFWRDHFVCPGSLSLPLPPGTYSYRLERGPEYRVESGQIRVLPEATVFRTNVLARISDLSREGWWSADLHVHRPLPDVPLLMQAEDLHLAPVITWWNGLGPWSSNQPPSDLVRSFDGNRFLAPLGGEDERGGGALLYFGLERPLPIAGLGREHPPSTHFLRAAKSSPRTWVDIEKPFWWDFPVWLATGLADSVGIAHNHLHPGGVLDSEAWGRPRDRAQFPGPQGNGRYTQELYYHLLNAGLRLPPSAGSASGVLPNPVGYNRTWVHVDGELTWEKWWDGLRAGRVFVGNGPLLRVRANGQWPGATLRGPGPGPLVVQLDVRLDSREPLAEVEVIRDGKAERLPSQSALTFHESGWFLVRAVADPTNTFRFASTAPWFVEIGKEPVPVRRESAQYFLDWTRQRAEAVARALPNPPLREESLEPIWTAETFWSNRVAHATPLGRITGEIVDSRDGRILPARIHVQDRAGRWYFPRSTAPDGSALRYERRNWSRAESFEFHTTLSAHPFEFDLPPGEYTVTVERGKEYRPTIRTFAMTTEPAHWKLPLERWVNMADRGWFSGDVHLHRPPSEVPNLLLAEDVNLGFPMTHWVTHAHLSPTRGDKNVAGSLAPGLVSVDATHAYWPRNTEYELFTVGGKPHMLGALFVLGHRSPPAPGIPPVGPMAEAAHREGALLDLDKHNWPWSMAVIPAAGVDLFELANNHHWRTGFAITNWGTPAPSWMLPHPSRGAEFDWISFTFGTYYALLDAGFRLRPSAGTGTGVHPVPLGFGRVYVHLPDGFGFDEWMKGLNAGRSFVTTGPMLLATISATEVRGTVLAELPLPEVEILVNGEVRHRLPITSEQNAEGAWEARFHQNISLQGTSWVAVRCFDERPEQRFLFAHTAPRWFDDARQPLRPRREEVEFLVHHVRTELQRSHGVLPEAALDEYRAALRAYEALLPIARP